MKFSLYFNNIQGHHFLLGSKGLFLFHQFKSQRPSHRFVILMLILFSSMYLYGEF